jgi:hypothetical protein
MARLLPADESRVPLEPPSAETFETGVLHFLFAPAE